VTLINEEKVMKCSIGTKNTAFIFSLVMLGVIALPLGCSKRCVEPFSCNEQQAVIITETILGPGDIF